MKPSTVTSVSPQPHKMSKDDLDEWAWRLRLRIKKDEPSHRVHEAREELRELLHKNELCMEGNHSDDVLVETAWRRAFTLGAKTLQITTAHLVHMLTPQDGSSPALNGGAAVVMPLSYWETRLPSEVLNEMFTLRMVKWHDGQKNSTDPDGLMLGIDNYDFHAYIGDLVEASDPTFSRPVKIGFFNQNKCIRAALMKKVGLVEWLVE